MRRRTACGLLGLAALPVASACSSGSGLSTQSALTRAAGGGATVPTSRPTRPPGELTTEGRSSPPARDVRAVLRSQDDASAPIGLAPPAYRLPFSFLRDGHGFRDIPRGLRMYDDGELATLKDSGVHDEHGVRMAEVQGTLYDHPTSQAAYGLQCLGAYAKSGDGRFLDRAIAQGTRLIDTRVESRGAWFFPFVYDFRTGEQHTYPMDAPWYSALAQGKALSLFVRLYQTTSDRRWRNAADRAFVSFLLASVAGGDTHANPNGGAEGGEPPYVVSRGPDGTLRLDEYPRYPTDRTYFTFNGHMSAIYGLWDYYDLTRDPIARQVFDGAVTTIARDAPTKLRNPHWVSHYGLTEPSFWIRHYHPIHMSQLIYLWMMTGNTIFVRLADELRGDYPPESVEATQLVDIEAGACPAYVFDLSNGKVTKQKTFHFGRQTHAPATRRSRIRGRGAYYLIARGPMRGYWLPETVGKVMIRGPVAGLHYHESRTVRFEAGRTYTGRTFDKAGTPTGSKTARSPAPGTFDTSAYVDGVACVRLLGGPLKDAWIPVEHLRLDDA